MEMKKKAKSDMLKKLSEEMQQMMREGYEDSDLKDKLMKVTVAAEDEDGLKKGLSKAEEIMKGRLGDVMMEDSEDEMEEESMEDDEKMAESDEAEKEQLLKKIAELEEQLKSKE